MAIKRTKKFVDEHYNVNDYYKVKKRIAEIAESLYAVYDEELLKFFGPTKVVSQGVKARKKIMKTIHDLKKVRDDISKQMKIYSSDYE